MNNNIYTNAYLETIASFNNIILEQTKNTIKCYKIKDGKTLDEAYKASFDRKVKPNLQTLFNAYKQADLIYYVDDDYQQNFYIKKDNDWYKKADITGTDKKIISDLFNEITTNKEQKKAQSDKKQQTITKYIFNDIKAKDNIKDIKEVEQEEVIKKLQEIFNSYNIKNKDLIAITINKFLYFKKDNKWYGKQYIQQDLKNLTTDLSKESSQQKEKVSDIIKNKYLVKEDQKKVLSLNTKFKEYDGFDDENDKTQLNISNYDEFIKVLQSITTQELVYNIPIDQTNISEKDGTIILLNKPKYIIQKQLDSDKKEKYIVYAVDQKQLQKLQDLLIERCLQSAGNNVSSDAIKKWKSGKTIPADQRNTKLQQQVAQTVAFRKTVKQLKLKDEEQENAFLGIFAKLFQLLFGANKKKYKQYSDMQLMNFARFTKTAVSSGSLIPGQYKIKFKG